MEKSLIGRFACSKAGHDKGTIYVIVEQDCSQVFLCDGKYHTLEKCKRKSFKHIDIWKESVDKELLQRILNKDKLFDYEIKYAIKKQKEGKEEGYVQK